MNSDEPAQWHMAPDPDDLRDEPGQDDPWDEPGPEANRGGPGAGPRQAGRPAPLTAAVAIVAAAAGATVGLAFLRLPASHVTAAPAASSISSPARPGTTQPSRSPLPGSGTGEVQMTVVGSVLAVSAHSITIGVVGTSVTASITSATEFTGTATSASRIKVGTEVGAQITGTGSSLTVTTLQDPAPQ